VLVVFGDSLSFCGPEGALEFTDTRTYPFVTSATLSELTGERWETQLECHAGWSIRDLAVQMRRPDYQSLIREADAAVVAVGSIDTFTVGLPGGLGLSHRKRPRLQHLELRWLRDWFQPRYLELHAGLITLTRERIPHTSRRQFRGSWSTVIGNLRDNRTPAFAFLPVKNRSPLFANSNRFHQARCSELLEMLERQGHGCVTAFDATTIVDANAAHISPDGLHWDFTLHQIVGQRLASAIVDRRLGLRAVV